MDVREKLAGLLNEAGDNVFIVANQPVEFQKKRIYDEIADYLIAHGVTVQEWISVKDRLPKPFVSVLVQMPGEEPFPTVREGFISKDGIWHSALYGREPDEVTHWRPMPQPPKGE